MDPVEAGHKGSNEIFFAIVLHHLDPGRRVPAHRLSARQPPGRLFASSAWLVAGSVLVSAFVSLTLTPCSATRLLKQGMGSGPFYRRTEPFFEAMTQRLPPRP